MGGVKMEAVKRKLSRLSRNVKLLLLWFCLTLALLLAEITFFHFVLELKTLLSFCILPFLGFVLVRIILVIRSGRRFVSMAGRLAAWAIVFFVLGFLNLIVFVFMPSKIYWHTKVHAQDRFEAALSEVYPEEDLIPLELGAPRNVVYHSYGYSFLFFVGSSDALSCRYDATDYSAQKAALETRYHFRTEPLNAHWHTYSESAEPVEPYAVIGDDCFRFLLPGDDDEYSLEFYKQCMISVTNGQKQEIVYLVYQDAQSGGVGDGRTCWDDECGWTCIR